MPLIVCYILLHIWSSYHFSEDPIKQYPTFFEKENRLVGKMWSSFRWIVKLVKFIRADSWGSDESKHETLLGDDCGGGRFDLWNRKGGVELSWGVDERKDIQSLTCHHKLSTTHLASGLRPFCLFLLLTPSLRININCNALYSCICIGRASQKKLQNPKRMPITNYFILFELCNSLVQAVLITFVWTGRKLEWMKWQTGSLWVSKQNSEDCWDLDTLPSWVPAGDF